MSLTSQAEEANGMYEALRDGVDADRRVCFGLGACLSIVKEHNLFKKAVGDMTWREFLSQPEIGIPVRKAEYLIGYYKLCAKYNKVIQAPEETLKFLVKNVDTLTETIIDDAQILSSKDFKERYYEVKTNDAPKSYDYVVMKRCKETGALTKEHNVSSADIEKIVICSI